MRPRVIIDADAIVATLNERDQWHGIAAPAFNQPPKPFYTCEAVISEACFLAGKRRCGVIGLIEDGIVELRFSLSTEVGAIGSLMKKYANVPMSLADACLVRMTELHAESVVFTFDTDFDIYLRHGRQIVETFPARS